MKDLNKYIENINRVEFTINNSCTSRCKHCSEGSLKGNKVLDGKRAAKVLQDIASVYKVDSIMTFGGEALLYPEVVFEIHKKAKKCGIPVRQIITNGYFSKDKNRIREVARGLEESGVNDILLSVDCFHEEFIPLEWVKFFAEELCRNYSGDLHLQPSWVVGEDHYNVYNEKTKQCLEYFKDLGIERNEGDAIFPEGNAIKYLSKYFKKEPIDTSFKCGDALYTTKLDSIDEIMIDCNGDVKPCNFSIGNIYLQDLIEILSKYNPYENIYTETLLKEGINGLIKLAEKREIKINLNECYSPCEVCRKVSSEVVYGK